MLLCIAVDGREKIKPGAVGDQLALKMQHGMTQRNLQKIADAFIRPVWPGCAAHHFLPQSEMPCAEYQKGTDPQTCGYRTGED